MARKYELITELYHQAQRKVTAPQEWQKFLTAASRNYRLPFDEQLLVYAQRPDATAVLEIERWRRLFGRWVNGGATGIAVFDSEHHGRSQLKHYFDISDTHETKLSRPVPIWTVREEYTPDIIESLENSFGEPEDQTDLAAALVSTASNVVQDNMADYLAELRSFTLGSFLEELDDLNVEVLFRELLKNSIAYMLLSRCGCDTGEYFTDDDFRIVVNFNTPDTLGALGTATGDMAKMCLEKISRTVLNLQKQEKRANRTFERTAKSAYPVNRPETAHIERSFDNDGTHIPHGERIPSAEPVAAAGAGGAAWEVRIAPQDVSAAAPPRDLHEPVDGGQAERAFGRDRADGAAPDGADHGADGESAGRDGAAESDRPDEVGGPDEQHPARSGGNDSARPDLQLTPQESEPQAGDEETEETATLAQLIEEYAGDGELPAFFDEKLIMGIVENRDDDLKFKKQQIELFFSIHPDMGERAEYLQSAYQQRYTELFVDNVRVGYLPLEKGLMMWEGAYPSRTKESIFSWEIVAEWVSALIEKKEYFINTNIKALAPPESQQTSFFDSDFSMREEAAGQITLFPRPQLSQQIIDEALCIGANEPSSRLIICAYFMKDKPLEDNARFLQEHYGENGAGFYFGDRKISIWYNADGIRMSGGETAQRSTATVISWEDAAKRIRELLDLGRYMPQDEIDRAPDHEKTQLAEALLHLFGDLADDNKALYFPTLKPAYEVHGGFPEKNAAAKKLLAQPDSLQALADECRAFVSAYGENRDILRWHYHRPKKILRQITDLQREPLIFTAAEGYDPQRRFFISSDELDKVLRGSTDYRLDVYSFYRNNPEKEARVKYLKNYHGEYSGFSGDNDDRTYTSKGLSFSHGSITEPYAKIELSWTKIEKRISELISSGKFISEEDRAAMPGYEKHQLARDIRTFFERVPQAQPHPYPYGFDFMDAVDVIEPQLDNPAKVEEIYQMMLPVWESTAQDDREYPWRKSAFENLSAFRDGTFSLFGESKKPNSAPAQPAEPPQPVESVIPISAEPDTNADFEQAKNLINEYCNLEFDQAADFSNLSHIDLAYSTTGDGEHPIEIYADLNAFKLVYTVDGEAVQEIACKSPSELNEYLVTLSFDSLIADAEEIFEQNRQEQESNAEATEPSAEEKQPKPETIVTDATPSSDQTGAENLIGRRLVMDDRTFEVESVSDFSGDVSLRDVTFENDVGFPITRVEKIGTVRQLLEQAEKEALPEKENTLAPPKPKRERVVFSTLHPEIPASQRHDHHITDTALGEGTRSEKYAANVVAIRLLKRIESEERLATPEEQEVLSRYVGWGGLADCFDERHHKYQELKALLDEDEYAAARASSLTAFYTSPIIVNAMYQALAQMGFQTGNILEPACGIGNFIGMLPEAMAGSKAYGVEIDSISGRIAQQLYQNSSIVVDGFEKVQMPDSFFDVAIGNVPFGDFKVLDKRYDKNHWLIHDYFFGKTLDKVRPGGIVAFITSKGTMDKENSAVRKYLAQRADLIGAIRLPDNAFKRNAGTEVTSDILFLQKRDRMTDIEPDWVHLDTDENGIRMNRYFVQHPDMVLGNMVMESTRFGMDSACKAEEGADLSEQLAEAIQNLHAEITSYEVDELDEEEDRSIPADPAVRNFSYTIVDGIIYFRENSRMHPVGASMTEENRIRGMIALRDCTRKLIELQTEGYPDEDIGREQAKLNTLYDDFTKKYGLISSRGNSLAFSEDSSYCLLCSLEVLDEEGNFKHKADMFTKRTIRPHEAVTSVDTASEALAVSISEKACVDMAYMAELSGKTEEELEHDLAGLIFRDIYCAETADEIPRAFVDLTRFPFVTADAYLSGNVRRKLRMAKALQEVLPAEKKEFISPNIAALEAVQPVDLTAGEIGLRISANWVPIEVYEQFMYELFGTNRYARKRMKLLHSKATNEWNITNKNADGSNIKICTTYGTKRVNAYHIFEQTLNQKDVRIFDYIEDEHGNRKPVLNKKETAIAQDRQELIKAKFSEWIWKDIDRREKLCRIYNETFNAIRPREYDGQHIRFSGMNPEITLRTHQINAIAHIMYGGNTLLAHEVGAGKTFEMVAAAMESKRLGLCTKSLVVVPNHITEQWAAEWLQLYPSANILVATKKDFERQNRRKFCGRIATGDFDAIIIGHSQFEKIPMSRERQEAILRGQIDDIMIAIEDAKNAKAERYTIKQLEKARKSLELRLAKLNDQSRKDDVVTFEELGVDRLFIDESHYFKNLFLMTKMRNVGGIAQTEAQKSSDLFMKCQYLDEITGGRGVIFATGTPISNSMVELYTIQRYLQYGVLQETDMGFFDDWAANFGETITSIELSPEGTGYRAKTRFARFFNLPELMNTFKMVADIQTADMLQLPVPKANFHTEVIKPSPLQQEMIKGLAERAEKIRDGGVDPSIDNMLKITNDGRKLALDMRLIQPMAPDDENGKIAVCARNVFRIWDQTQEQRSAQLVFCDLSTPKGDGSFNVYDDLRDKLMVMGVPEEEIAYIHNANTEVKKKELFAKVRLGQVRVLIGSTQKMGAGTNVQDRLIALHDLDCPWRPSDVGR